MKIEAILQRKGHAVIMMAEGDTALDAARVLVEHGIGSVVITEGDRLAGIFTERDLLRLTAETPGELHSITIGSAMTRTPVTAHPDDELTDMMGLMTERKIRHLPVVVGEQVIGIVSIGDLLHACRSKAEEENSHLRQYIQGVG